MENSSDMNLNGCPEKRSFLLETGGRLIQKQNFRELTEKTTLISSSLDFLYHVAQSSLSQTGAGEECPAGKQLFDRCKKPVSMK